MTNNYFIKNCLFDINTILCYSASVERVFYDVTFEILVFLKGN